MKKILPVFAILILAASAATFLPLQTSALESGQDAKATLQVDTTCGNGVCDTTLGENADTCAIDCAVPTPTPTSTPTPTPTPSPTPVATPTATPGGAVIIYDTKPPLIYDLSIKNITFNSAGISWKTNEQSFCAVFWGRTYEYKEESIIGVIYSLSHSTDLKNLLPAAIYHFKIACWDLSKNEAGTSDQQFITLIPADIIAPSNVLNFEALPGDSQVLLKWQNPTDSDFKGVRIVRSKSFYIFNSWEGTLVYNGAENLYIDKGLKNGIKYYYTAFAYDRAGNYASGAIASAIPGKVIPSKPVFPVFPTPSPAPKPLITPLPMPTPVPAEIKLNLEDFDFFQEGKKLPLLDGKTIRAKADIPLTVFIAQENLPKQIKALVISIAKGARADSYIFKQNSVNSGQETIFTVSDKGAYSMQIYGLDLQNRLIKTLLGEIIIESVSACPSLTPIVFQLTIIWLLLAIIILLIIILIIETIKLVKKQYKS